MARMPTSRGMDPPGTPAAPTAVSTDMITTMICWPRFRSRPNTWARNSTVMPSNSEVPFMHIVLPMGSTKPAMDCGTPMFFSMTARLVGSVALLLLVEKAVTMDVRMRPKNSRGEMPMRDRRMSELVPKAWMISAPMTTST
jgi:hypothetical protein